MNARATIAAEGLPRRAFTVEDVYRMAEIGLIGPDERVELIGGELVPMSPKGSRHTQAERALMRWWRAADAQGLDLLVAPTLRLSDDTFAEPDFVFIGRVTRTRDVAPANVLLVLEVADATLGYDLGRKPALYAAAGLRELWVVDASTHTVHVHRAPGPGGYSDVHANPPGSAVEAAFAPTLRLDPAALEFDD